MTTAFQPAGPLQGDIALVTGATSGLGLHFAQVLADAGAAVAVTGRRVERLQPLVEGIIRRGGRAVAAPLDVTQKTSIEACLSACEAALGPVNLLINNAGMNVEARATELSEDDYDRIMDTNVKGSFMMAQAVARRLIQRKSPGRIINIASIGAHRVLPGLAAYCTSKAAVAMMTKALAREWARHNIAVNAISPGYIETEINSDWFKTEGGQRQIASWPRRRLATQKDLDGALLLLASSGARAITGSVLTVDDGQSL